MSTREQLQARLDVYLATEVKILAAQEFVVGQGSTARRTTRADLTEVRKAITDLQREIAQLDNTARRTRRVFYIRPY